MVPGERPVTRFVPVHETLVIQVIVWTVKKIPKKSVDLSLCSDI